MIVDRVDEITPRGGAYSTCTYLDDKWEPVERREDAVIFVIGEYTADGHLIAETIGRKD